MEDVKQTETIVEEKKEEKVEENKATTNEEKPVKTYTQEEVEQIKKNAIAEGMRKASKQAESQTNEELDKLKASYSESQSKLEDTQKELTAIKQVNKMNELGIDKNYQEDVIALIKGKGLEVNEETIADICGKHPEWKADKQLGVGSMGQTRQNNNAVEEAEARKQKNIKELFRL